MSRPPNPDRDALEDGRGTSTLDLVREAARELDATGAGAFEFPPPRDTWSPEVTQSYFAYQRDVSARAAREVDLAMIFRYFDSQEMTARVFEELIADSRATNSLTVDSGLRGVAAHPLLAIFARLVATSIRVANEIGATPMSRVKLGLYALEGANAKHALERKINEVSDVQVSIDVEDGDDIEDALVVRW